MKKNSIMLMGAIAVVLAFSVSSCGSIVNKPVYSKMKKVALVSVAGNQTFVNKNRNGQFSDVTYGGETKEILQNLVAGLFEAAPGVVTKELSHLKGLKIVHPKEFVQSTAFKTFSADMSEAWRSIYRDKESRRLVSSFQNNMPVAGPTFGFAMDKNLAAQKAAITAFCQTQGLDGVVLVETVYWAKIKTRVIGSSGAIPNNQTSMAMYDKNGTVAVSTVTGTSEGNEVDATTFFGGFKFDADPINEFVAVLRNSMVKITNRVNGAL